MVRHRLGTVLQAVVVLALVAIVVGQFIGQPVLVTYVTSDSMAPTISAGDGYLVLPSVVAGPVEEGDVIVFNAKTLHGGKGGLTTHRVVGETEQGFLTRGDNNPFTDQSGGEPPVKRVQIVGQAVSVGENPVVIPHLGTALTGVRSTMQNVQRWLAIRLGMRSLLGTRGLAYILLGIGGVLYAGSVVAERRNGGAARRRSTGRRRRRGGLLPRRVPKILLALALGGILVAGATVAMTVAGGVHEFGVVSAERDSPEATIIPAGGSERLDYSVPNGGVVPIVAYVDAASTGVETPTEGVLVRPGERETVGVELAVPPSTGYYPRYVVEHRYIAVLPRSWIHRLYLVHPWLPVVVIDALILAVFMLVAVPIIGRGTIRPHATRRPLVRRIKRLLR